MLQTSRLLVDGKEIKNVTTADLNLARHVIHGSIASGDEDISFGFTSFLKLEEWLSKQTTEEQKLYEFLFTLRRLARKEREITSEEEEKIKDLQISRVSQVEDESTSRGINAQIKLYRYPNYEGKHLYLDTGAYRNLGYFDFDNITTSYKSSAGCFAFFQYTNFGGKDYIRLTPKNQPQMEWWNNRLSSLMYASYFDIGVWLAKIGISIWGIPVF